MENAGAAGLPAGANAMQRPQPGNVSQQLHATILNHMQRQGQVGTGWQSTFDIRQRAAQVMQL